VNAKSSRVLVIIIAHVALLFLSAACAREPGTALPLRPGVPVPSPLSDITAQPSRSPLRSTDEPTSPPLPTPEDIGLVAKTLLRALQAPDANGLAPLMLDEIFLAQGPVGEQGQATAQTGALEWLNAHWSSHLQVSAVDYVEHTVQLEITTRGWSQSAPIQSGIVVFHLHRYNEQTQIDPFHGEWRVDGIFYQ
jgi:hypothetical protein